jgi:CubicO group peptidase (beta-lactamase class C family)
MASSKLDNRRGADLHETIAGYVERGEIPSIVTLIGRSDEIFVDAIGMKTIGGKQPMRCDTILRIASITKPIVAAATMILVDNCKLRLGDAVERWRET